MPFDGRVELFTKPSVADVLKRAKALIDTPEKWGQGNGLLNPRDLGKDQLCVLTAIGAVNGMGVADHLLEKVTDCEGPRWLGDWNDEPGRTHADVMHAFDKAIALAEQE
jgi:hypothetical protein